MMRITTVWVNGGDTRGALEVSARSEQRYRMEEVAGTAFSVRT